MRRRRPRAGLVVVILAAAVGAGIVIGRLSSGSADRHPARLAAPGRGPTIFGVLNADVRHLAADQAGGVRLVTLNVGWDRWEPAAGQFDASYRAQEQGIADQYRAAGMSVAVDVGLQYPPSWAGQLPNGQLIDQGGHHPGPVDFAWSQAVRDAATAYLDNVVAALGPVVDYRVGLSENGEALYPDTNGNQWWAYTPSAQGQAPGLPSGLSSTPMPGWVPGTSTYQGQAVTVAEASTWYDWYFSGSVSALAWEIAAYRSAGYQGQLELVMPGDGSLPGFYEERLADLLADGSDVGLHYDDFHTMNTAAVWWKLLDDLPDLHGVAIDISSVDDSSGTPRANACRGADTSVSLDSHAIWSWSDTRWLTYLAAKHGLPVLGENPGGTPAAQLPNIVGLLNRGHLEALQWAFDDQLHDGAGATLDQVGDDMHQVQAAERDHGA